MLKNIYKYILFFMLSIAFKMYAQNDLHVSHYMFNMLLYNPAVSGNANNIQGTITARKQWVGFNGAPTLGFITAHAYVGKLKGGVGFAFSQDKIGFENITTLRASYAYHLKLKNGHDVSGGLGFGFNYKAVNVSKFILDEGNDQLAMNVPKSKLVPDLNFGFEYNWKDLQVGLASTHIQQGVQTADVFKIPRHYYVYGRYYYHASDKVMLVPSFLTKTTSFISQIELNASVVYDKKYWVGVTWRNKEAMVCLVGYAINQSFRIGYAYDYTGFSQFKTYSNGSHELCFIYNGKPLNQNHHHFKNPRFFN